MDSFVNNIFTDVQPVDYAKSAADTHKHLYYRDYKHLKNVSWNDDHKINWFEVLTLLIAFASIAIVLFLSEV